jgi:hypothetical protein
MAFVVARPGKRFEIRESVATERGPRSRSLANFSVLTDDVLAAAQKRAARPFDAAGVVASARRAGAPVKRNAQIRSFVEASRRMSVETGRAMTPARRDPGETLLDLLGFTDLVLASKPGGRKEPLRYPPLARLATKRR